MSVLFLSSKKSLSEQDMLLMLSIAKDISEAQSSDSFVYACPEGSCLASVAQHNAIVTLEIPHSFWKQFFTLRLYLKRTRSHEPMQIHVFDAEAYRVAKWLRRSLGSSLRIFASFHDALSLNQTNPFAEPKIIEKQTEIEGQRTVLTDNCPTLKNFQPEKAFSYVFRKDTSTISYNTALLREFIAKKIERLFVSSPELFRILENQNIGYNRLALLPFSSYGVDPNVRNDFIPHLAPECNAEFKKNNPASQCVHGLCLAQYDLEERFIFLVHTAMEEESGISIFLQALAMVKDAFKSERGHNHESGHKSKSGKTKNLSFPKALQIHICGTGSKFSEFVQEAKDLQVDEMIAFFGEFEPDLLYENAHALICPAMTGEGDFRSIIRGWRASLPVVSSDISPHTKLVLTGKTQRSALIFPRDNAETLAKCMIHVMTDTKLREELIIEGREVLAKNNYLCLAELYRSFIRKTL